MTRRALLWAALLAGLSARPALARIGLSTQFIDVVVEGLRPGGTYSLRELRGSSYAVKNRGDAVVEVSLEALRPAVLVPPYEAVPDPAWVELTPGRLRIEPGQLGVSEVVLRIPDDPRLAGRHFQATLLARTLGTGIVGTGVKSRLRFSLGPSPETVNFDLSPGELSLSKPRAGPAYDSRKAEGRGFALANRTNVALRLRLEAARWTEGTEPLPPGGWETPSELSWVRLEPALATVGAFGSVEVRVLLEGAPASLAGRNAAFLVQPRLEDGTAVGRPSRVLLRFRPAAKSGWWPWRR